MKMVKRKKIGFTLVELLVVISIIALLLAILMPSLQKAREQAIQLVCGTQQKDLGMAFAMYIDDNNGEMPTSTKTDKDGNYARWSIRLAYYYPQAKAFIDEHGFQSGEELFDEPMYRCPTQRNIKEKEDDPALGSYGYNIYFTYQNNQEKYNIRKYNDIHKFAEVPVMADLSGEKYIQGGGGQHLQPGGPHPLAMKKGFMQGESDFARLSRTRSYGAAPNHGRNCNFLFADWHVEARDVCDESKWPWYDDFDISTFHPLGKSNSRR